MLKVNSGGDGYSNNWARFCDSCHAAACTFYCYTESAYLCNICDECIHASDPMALQHKRVRVCTMCRNAPEAFTCQADAASLCVNCDIEVHSANVLARRHTRVPIVPLSGIVRTSSNTYLEEMKGHKVETENGIMTNKSNEQHEEDETDSWLLLDLNSNDNQTNSGFTYGDEIDEYFDIVEYNSCSKFKYRDQNDQPQTQSACLGDDDSNSVVPVQSLEANKQKQQQQQNIYFNREYAASKLTSINATSTSQTVPIPFVNAGYLMKATTSDISNSYPRFPRGTTSDLFSTPPPLMPLQLMLTSREARVLRYKEKRKARKFDKKIRYASRKANAETRPRVKGRFARKTDTEFEVDQMISSEDYEYGIVPSY